ncbi:MAG: germination protein YpeB [Clostridia bacterium]|nr:germination protein YpeB [Clostridia bacterium]
MRGKNKKNIVWIVLIILIGIIIALGYNLNKKNKESILANENLYNQSLYELIYYMDNVQNYLAKSTISNSATHGAETLTNLWREANLAQTYLSMLPMQAQELENTEKFLNQVSDYSYSLSRKNIQGEKLSDDDLKNLEELHKYSMQINNVVNQISFDLNAGNMKWSDLTGEKNVNFAQQVSTDFNFADTLEENLHQYSGLIYDGAYSEHIVSVEKRGLKGDKISEEDAKKKAVEFVGENNIEEISSLGYSEKAAVPAYTFTIKNKNQENITISISETGGSIVYMTSDREVSVENLTYEQANEKGIEFLNQKGFNNMKQTYYLKNEGVITINYAYQQDGVLMYPDLIKLKVALDNGQILGIETTGYLNNHTQRDVSKVKITKEQAKEKLNKNLNIQSETLAIIPTEWKTEKLCYEFKGKVEETEYLVYINAENGEEEQILIITNTPNGVLTM